MFCKNCGKDISDNAAVCPYCGVQVGKLSYEGEAEGNTIAIVGFVLSFLIALAGLICSIIGYNKAKKGAPYKGLALAGIIISCVEFVAYFAVIIVTCSAVAAAVV